MEFEFASLIWESEIESWVCSCGACAYEYERTGDKAALDLWDDKWRKKFIDLFKICS